MGHAERTGTRSRAFDWESAKTKLASGARESTTSDKKAIFRARAIELANASRDVGSAEREAYLRFRIGRAVYAVALSDVDCVVRPRWITFIPRAPRHLERAFQHASRIVALVDLGGLLGNETSMHAPPPEEVRRADENAPHERPVIVLAEPALGLAIEPDGIDGLTTVDLGTLAHSSMATDSELVRGVTSELVVVVGAAGLARRARSLGASIPHEPRENRS